MLRFLHLWIVLMVVSTVAVAQEPAIGQWRDHLPWRAAQQILITPNTLWCATAQSVYSLDRKTGEITTLSKVQGLSESGIAAIGWDATTASLIIAYTNGKIDLLREASITPITALYKSSRSWNKTINHISTANGRAFLSTAFGIVVIDLAKAEIADTYLIGAGGLPIGVTATCNDGQTLYASTAEGLRSIGLNDPQGSDYRNWRSLHGTPSKVVTLQGELYVLENDTLWKQEGNARSLMFANGSSVDVLEASSQELMLIVGQQLFFIKKDHSIALVLSDSRSMPAPTHIAKEGDDIWIADRKKGLMQWDGTRYNAFVPAGPDTIFTHELIADKPRLWAGTGTGHVALFQEQEWLKVDSMLHPALKPFTNIQHIAVDPTNGTLWGSDSVKGLFSYNGNTVSLQPTPGGKKITLMHVDAQQQVWAVLDSNLHALWVRKKEGLWRSFTIPYAFTGEAIKQLITDDWGQVWAALPASQGMVCFSYGGTLDNPSDDRWKIFRTGQGNGNLPDNEVLDMHVDRDGFLWIGTAKGIGILQCPQEVFTTTGCEVYLPIVQQGNFAAYLFRDKAVKCIVTDGANRKWIGTTEGGVWLIDAEGSNTLLQFNRSNSPLPSDRIKRIAVMPISGEVFMLTDAGLVSYRGTATEGREITPSPVLVFPNPVPPEHKGVIAIRGLKTDAEVHITELSGRLVYKTRSLGGQAIWHGKDMHGQSVAPGIYLVLVQDNLKTYKTTTKIVFIGHP